MSGLIEQVGRALADEERYAYDPLPYDARAVAAIKAIQVWFEAEAKRNSWDEHEMLMAAATLKAALDSPSQITPHKAGS